MRPTTNKALTVLLATMIAVATGSAYASEIYRYTDADGNVHYVDRPSGLPDETRVAIASRRTNPQAPARRSDSGAQPPTPAAAAQGDDVADAPKKKTRAEIRAEQRERAEKCQSYRAKLETMVTARRLYREDENGERTYLDDAQIQEARDRVQALIEETCD